MHAHNAITHINTHSQIGHTYTLNTITNRPDTHWDTHTHILNTDILT